MTTRLPCTIRDDNAYPDCGVVAVVIPTSAGGTGDPLEVVIAQDDPGLPYLGPSGWQPTEYRWRSGPVRREGSDLIVPLGERVTTQLEDYTPLRILIPTLDLEGQAVWQGITPYPRMASPVANPGGRGGSSFPTEIAAAPPRVVQAARVDAPPPRRPPPSPPAQPTPSKVAEQPPVAAPILSSAMASGDNADSGASRVPIRVPPPMSAVGVAEPAPQVKPEVAQPLPSLGGGRAPFDPAGATVAQPVKSAPEVPPNWPKAAPGRESGGPSGVKPTPTASPAVWNAARPPASREPSALTAGRIFWLGMAALAALLWGYIIYAHYLAPAPVAAPSRSGTHIQSPTPYCWARTLPERVSLS